MHERVRQCWHTVQANFWYRAFVLLFCFVYLFGWGIGEGEDWEERGSDGKADLTSFLYRSVPKQR